jgi:hypothetical protein
VLHGLPFVRTCFLLVRGWPGAVGDDAATLTPGQYLRARPDEELVPQLASQWAAAGLVKSDDATPFVTAAVQAAKKSLVGCRKHGAQHWPQEALAFGRDGGT